jgi:hypothetical protein
MRQNDWRSLSLVLAGAIIGFIVIFVPPQQLNILGILGLSALALFFLTYGVGIPQHYYHRLLLDCRKNQPFRIGIMNDMGSDTSDDQIFACTDIPPENWKATLEQNAKQRGVKIHVGFVKTSQNFDKYIAILNPYGSVYPESDLKNLTTLKKILDFVKEGGIVVNVADIPSYWAYSPTLHRRVDATPSVYVGAPVVSGVQIASLRPFDLTPLMKELSLRCLNEDQGIQISLNNIVPGTNPNVTLRRRVVVESNVESLANAPQITTPTSKIDTSPLFIVRYGEGDFLISLIWINDSTHTPEMKELIKIGISTSILTRIVERFVDKDRA